MYASMNQRQGQQSVAQVSEQIKGSPTHVGAAIGLAQPEQVRKMEIHSVCGDLQHHLNCLGEEVAGLTQRLSPVMRPQSPQTENSARATRDMPATKLGAELSTAVDVVQTIRELVRDAVQRLEV